MLIPLAIIDPFCVHSYVVVGISPSGSDTSALHVTTLLLPMEVGDNASLVIMGSRLDSVIDTESLPWAPASSVVVAVQLMFCVGRTPSVDISNVSPEWVFVPTVHTYVGVTVWSASLALALQVSIELLYAGSGVMEIESMVGVVFSMETLVSV